MPQDDAMIDIDVERLRPNPYQVRVLDETDHSLQELMDSLTKFGLIEPLIVRSTTDGWWEIAAGHRRWLSYKLLGIPKIKCVQRRLSDEQMCESILDENLRRQSLNPLEEAKAYRNLREKFSWTEEKTAARFHVSRDIVAQRIRLLSFQQPLQDLVAKGELGVSHAEAIATAPASKQLELARTVISARWTVKDTSERAKQLAALEKTNREMLENIGPTLLNLNQRLERLETRPTMRFIIDTAEPIVLFTQAWKAERCKNNVKGMCHGFSWPSEPTSFAEQLRGIAKVEKLSDGVWHIQACGPVCSRCELYVEGPAKVKT